MAADEWSTDYIAGFFDGEGNVGIYKGGGTGRTLRAQITQVISPYSTSLLEHLRESWGGSLTSMNRTNPNARPAWIYQAGGDNAASFLRHIHPRLYSKKPQVDLALLWHAARPARQRDAFGRVLPRSQEDREFSDRVASVLKRMKWGEEQDYAADLLIVRQMLNRITP